MSVPIEPVPVSGDRRAHRSGPGREFVKVYPDAHAHLLAEHADGRRRHLAIATMSLDWNVPTEGPGGFQEVLLDAYGLAADVDRIAYYRQAWDASEDDRAPLAG